MGSGYYRQQEIEQKNVHEELTDSPLPWLGLKLLLGWFPFAVRCCAQVAAVAEPGWGRGRPPGSLLLRAKRQEKGRYLGFIGGVFLPLLRKNGKGEGLV